MRASDTRDYLEEAIATRTDSTGTPPCLTFGRWRWAVSNHSLGGRQDPAFDPRGSRASLRQGTRVVILCSLEWLYSSYATVVPLHRVPTRVRTLTFGDRTSWYSYNVCYAFQRVQSNRDEKHRPRRVDETIGGHFMVVATPSMY